MAQPVGDCVSRLTAALDAHHGQATFLRDIVHRYPELKGGIDDSVAARLQAAITIGDDAAVARDGDAALVIHLPADGSACEWRVDPGRIQASAEVLQRQCAVFLRAAFSAPDVAAGRVPVIDAAERHRLLVEWNDTARAITGPRTIPDQFEAQVARSPDAPAVATWRGGLSYRALNGRANRLARTLQARGVTPGSLVGLHLERSVDMVVALLGVLKAGAAYLPLDPAYPIERTRTVVADSGAALVVTQSGLAAMLPPEVARLEIDTAAAELAAQPDGDVTRPIGPHDLAYVIYTSGSTGGPKGVMLEHGNVTSFFAAMDSCIGVEKPGVWLAVTSLSFDISVLELLWTVCRGFSVVVHCDPRSGAATSPPAPASPIDLSLFYFSSDESTGGAERYRLLTEGAVFADRHGFEAVWTPERHFHAFGGLYPESGDHQRGDRRPHSPGEDSRRLAGAAIAPPGSRRRGLVARRQPVEWPRRHRLRFGLASERLRPRPRKPSRRQAGDVRRPADHASPVARRAADAEGAERP